MSWQFLLLNVLFVVVHCSFDLNNLQSISSGTSFGMCRGYCQQSINITINPLQITTKREPNFPQSAFPSVQKTSPFSSGQWQELSAVLNLKAFSMLGATIGCADWIQSLKSFCFAFWRLFSLPTRPSHSDRLYQRLRQISTSLFLFLLL